MVPVAMVGWPTTMPAPIAAAVIVATTIIPSVMPRPTIMPITAMPLAMDNATISAMVMSIVITTTSVPAIVAVIMAPVGQAKDYAHTGWETQHNAHTAIRFCRRTGQHYSCDSCRG